MLKVHMNDGTTTVFNLTSPGEVASWLEHARSTLFQSKISALTISTNGVQYSMRKPRGFDRITMEAEFVAPKGKIKGGERIVLQAGEVRVTVFIHAGPRAARIDVEFTGPQVYNPLTDRSITT